jgi:hypothetical protein
MVARLAWNNWPDTDASRREIAAYEARDPTSAAAWDRVVVALVGEVLPTVQMPRQTVVNVGNPVFRLEQGNPEPGGK